MANFNGSAVTYGTGTFKLKGTYEYTDGGGMQFTAKFEFQNGTKFRNPQKLKLKWWGADGISHDFTTTKEWNKDHTFSTYTVNGTELTVAVSAGNCQRWSQQTVYAYKTVAPSKVEATPLNDACIRIDVEGSSSANYPTSKVTIERSTDGVSYSSIAELTIDTNDTSYAVSYNDTSVEAGGKYYYRAKAYNSVKGDSAYRGTDAVYTSPDSGDITNVTTTTSGSKVTVSWTCALTAINSGSITSFIVMRSVNGCTYQKAGEVETQAGQTSYSYEDTITSGGSYEYQVYASGSGGQSSGGTSGSSEVTTAPNDPDSVSVYRNASDNVVITVNGSSDNAEEIEIEKSTDGGDYENIATLTYPTNTTTDTDALASETLQYRACYTNDDGSSNWKYSVVVPTRSRPNAPNLKSPYNGTPIDKAQGTVRLVWEHRPTDGSPQQAAILQYKVNSGSWVTVNLTTATYYDLSLTSFSANDVITWQVKTKGSHADYSDFSSTYTMTLLTKPTLAFTSPNNASVITSLPLTMAWTYNDSCGTLKELKVDVVKSNEVVKSFSVDVGAGTSGSYSYSLAGFLFENNSVYGLKAYALSSSGLSTEANISVTIQYAEVSVAGGLLPSVVSDSETGYAYITCLRDVTDDATPVTISSAYLYRVHDNETTLISAVTEGMQILDKYAPINADYQYKLLYMTSTGAVCIVSVTVRNMSNYWFCYFGDEIAKAIWNPTGSVSLSRPQRKEVRYSGRRFPVSYDQDALEETYSFSTVLMEREQLNQFRKLMQKGGQGIWKSGDGDCYDANFEFSYSNDFQKQTLMWNCTLDVSRIDGGE